MEHSTWAAEKATPVTTAAGQVSLMPRKPSRIKTRIRGTTTASSGAWRPTTAPMWSASRPVRLAAVVIGMAMAPKATGAVLATSTAAAAFIGFRPRATSMVAVIATGAPNPASASSRPPKQKATRIAWMRTSPPPITSKTRRRSSKRPLTTVTWYSQIAMITIHTTGNAPKTAPWDADSRARPAGILNAQMATAIATSSDNPPATWALTFTKASRMKNVSRGISATMADAATLPNTGSVVAVK